jgi:hypothetical protein
MKNIKKLKQTQPDLYNNIEEKARMLGYIGSNQSLSDMSPEPGSMLEAMIEIEVSNFNYATNVIPTGDPNADAIIAEIKRIHGDNQGRRGTNI